MKVIIGTRKSKLALVQTDIVINYLKQYHKLECDKLLIKTLGDKILNVTLDKIGGKGLFVKDIELAMVEGRAQAAVHSMKDVPHKLPKGFEIVAIPKREDPRDVFISLDGIHFNDLKKGAVIGTSSKRRGEQLKLLRPDIEVVPIRGNVQTRIDKIRTQNLDGIILAAAGLNRLNLQHLITDYFNVKKMVPAIGQGALGIEALIEYPDKYIFKDLECSNTRMCVEAERAFMRTLDGDCHSTIGAYAHIKGDSIHIIGIFDKGQGIIKKEITGEKHYYKQLGQVLAEKILEE